jgi:hypothetical protein
MEKPERISIPLILVIAGMMAVVALPPVDALLQHTGSRAVLADYRRVWQAASSSGEVGAEEIQQILERYHRHREVLEHGQVRERYEIRVGIFPWGRTRRAAIEVLYSNLGRVVSVSLDVPQLARPAAETAG